MSLFLGSSVNDKFKVFIKFSVYPDSPDYFCKWDGIRHILLRFKGNIGKSLLVKQDEIFNRWKDNCLLESNRQLPLLNLVGDPNPKRTNKQIRIIDPDYLSGQYHMEVKGEIRMEITDGIHSEMAEVEKIEDILDTFWSLEEVEDILQAFVKTCNYYLCSEGKCKGQIILEHVD